MDLDVLLAIVGVIVTVMVGLGMVIAAPRGVVPVSQAREDEDQASGSSPS
jgi:hypothetical protein